MRNICMVWRVVSTQGAEAPLIRATDVLKTYVEYSKIREHKKKKKEKIPKKEN